MSRPRPTRFHLLGLGLVLFLVSAPVQAEDSVAIFGNYYKERSTRIVAPMITVKKVLPLETEVEATYLVDQITSASGSFTPEADVAFQEYRNEVRFKLSQRFGEVTPRIGFRYSTESDYTSLEFSGEVKVEFNDKNTTLIGKAILQFDDVERRDSETFREKLQTQVLSLNVAQVLTPELIARLCLETQINRGYNENPYRSETHPEARNRYSIGVGGAYRFDESKTTLRVDYRYYSDTWDVRAHTVGLEVSQEVVPSLEVVPKVRFHSQTGVFFIDLAGIYSTQDPKLQPGSTGLLGLQLLWRPRFLDGTPFQGAVVQPSYSVYFQPQPYGLAHIAQLGGYWAF